jgi:hypothetical protein
MNCISQCCSYVYSWICCTYPEGYDPIEGPNNGCMDCMEQCCGSDDEEVQSIKGSKDPE